MTALVIAEKKSAAEKFASALGGMKGSFEGTPYRIIALQGHLLELARPHEQVGSDMAAALGSWDPASMPWPRQSLAWERIPIEQSRAILEAAAKAIRSLGSGDEAVIATDVDPSGEGELLAWEVLDFAGYDGPVSRMYFEDEEPGPVRRAFSGRKAIERATDGDLAKAIARDKWDYLSMQLTRLATSAARSRGYETLVRVGRLKSVMVSECGRQLAAHATYKRVPFYEARYRDELGNSFKRADAEEAGLRIASADAVGIEALSSHEVVVEGSESVRKAPPVLFDLARLQATLAKEGFDPAEVIECYQRLYEDGIVSYPRTEDKKVTPAQREELLPLTGKIAALVGVNATLLTHDEPRKAHVATGGAHGANRPGPKVPATLEELSRYGECAAEIYSTLARSWLATLAEDAVYERTRAHLDGADEYKCTITKLVSPGWRGVLALADEDDDEQAADAFGTTAEPYCFEGAPERPKAPTMEWLRRRLERYDIGTGATRASTLAEVTGGSARALMAQDKGKLTLTEAGSLSLMLLDGCRIADPGATERLFSDMEQVGRFEIGEEELLRGFDELLAHDMARIDANARSLKEAPGAGKCPRCGAPVRKRGRGWACSSNRYRKAGDGSFEQVAGCGFRIAPFAGRELTQKQAESLLSGKQVPLKNLKSQSGKAYSCKLALDAASDYGCKPIFDKKGKGGKPNPGKAGING